MFGSETLDVALALVLVFYVLSTAASAVNEAAAGLLSLRAKKLGEGVHSLLGDPAIAEQVLQHPLIQGLAGRSRLPSYIPSHIFATAVIDSLVSASTDPPTLEALKAALAAQPELKETLLPLINQGEQNLKSAREAIEKWFDNGMDRVSGWYRRDQFRNIVVIALIGAAVFNADALMIANTVTSNPGIRTAIVEAAKQRAAQGQSTISVDEVRSEMADIQFPLGWTNLHGAPGQSAPRRVSVPNDFPRDAGAWAAKVIGLLLTVVAV